MKRIIFLVLLALAAGAQAGKKDHPVSDALRVVRAAHFKQARDATSKDMQTAVAKSSLRGSSTAMGAIGAGTAAGVFTPSPGLSPSTASGLALASAFFSGMPVGYPEISPRVLVWMPQELAATAEEAQAAMREIWVKAIAASTSEARVELVPAPLKSRVQSYVSIVGPGCADCRIYSAVLEARTLPKVEKMPEFLGAGDAYTWGHPKRQGNGLFSGYPWTSDSLTPDERQAFLVMLSSKLPQWVYLYLPPDPRLAPYPQVLHQGEVLLFLEPGVDAPAIAGPDQVVR